MRIGVVWGFDGITDASGAVLFLHCHVLSLGGRLRVDRMARQVVIPRVNWFLVVWKGLIGMRNRHVLSWVTCSYKLWSLVPYPLGLGGY